jgi:hypothetical protein
VTYTDSFRPFAPSAAASSYAGGRPGSERAARHERSSERGRGAAGSPDPALVHASGAAGSPDPALVHASGAAGSPDPAFVHASGAAGSPDPAHLKNQLGGAFDPRLILLLLAVDRLESYLVTATKDPYPRPPPTDGLEHLPALYGRLSAGVLGR